MMKMLSKTKKSNVKWLLNGIMMLMMDEDDKDSLKFCLFFNLINDTDNYNRLKMQTFIKYWLLKQKYITQCKSVIFDDQKKKPMRRAKFYN